MPYQRLKLPKFVPDKNFDIDKNSKQTFSSVRDRLQTIAIQLWYDLYGKDHITEGFISHFFNRFEVTKVDDKHYKISGLFTRNFFRDVVKHINKGRKFLKIFDIVTESKLLLFKSQYAIVHTFFIPDIYALLLDLYVKTGNKDYLKKAKKLKESTWLKNVDSPTIKTKLDWSKLSDIKWSLKPFQKEFIENYPTFKDKLELRGYILAFDQGLGKTFTSLVLMHLLNKSLTVIVCPKTLMFNWKNEIQNIFKDPPKDQDIYVVGESTQFSSNTKYIIVNYERISQIIPLLANYSNIGLIVDECQNFRNIKAQRTQSLINLIRAYPTKINDTLLLSGTPIKSNYAELAPYLYIIDPKFDDEALKKWLKVFNVDASIASDIIRYRLSLISFRKMKQEVLNLPEKKHLTITVTVPDVHRFTISTFKKLLIERYHEKLEKYEAKFEHAYHEFVRLLDTIKQKCPNIANVVDEYENIIKHTQEGKLLEYLTPEERKHIYTLESTIENCLKEKKLTSLKKQFVKLKTIVSRITYKAFGEAVGELLFELRYQMLIEIYKYNIDKIRKIISESSKTVIFTYVSKAIPDIAKFIEKHCNVKVVTLTGETKDRAKVIELFRKNEDIKVLVTSYQIASVGLTLTEADTLLYADKPYREADLKQAEDRIYRIGQQRPVKIIYLKLRSNEPTIQDRIDEIVKYFGTIVNLVM